MEDQIKFRTAPRARPAAGYIGGKRQLAARLAERIASTPHEIYAEAFVGMGGVFFRRETAPRCEVINDKSQDVAVFFRILQRHYQAFMDMLKWQLSGRAEFERLRAQNPDTLTDLERAARFLYLQKLSFGGKVAGRTFGIQTGGPARFDALKLGVALEAIHARLAGVMIECLDWKPFLNRWDRAGTLFFLDPPYAGTEDYYGPGLFGPEQHELMADALSRLKGHFILTINDTPATRKIYRRFEIEAAELTYSAGGADKRRPAREIIVSG